MEFLFIVSIEITKLKSPFVIILDFLRFLQKLGSHKPCWDQARLPYPRIKKKVGLYANSSQSSYSYYIPPGPEGLHRFVSFYFKDSGPHNI